MDNLVNLKRNDNEIALIINILQIKKAANSPVSGFL
jgi:hypothetical protein|tara:strand:- start:532 stop:639 length:108 start_codon:yes stop_codon:yes gene_type:complete